uniref:UspA domain-containing protein n=1 Tax=Araucaria cunninghamii TaxID=56994 RepID=A0A0D6R347_ARACU
MEGVRGRRVLVAVDDSEQSMYALKWAVDHLQLSCNDTLVLCHVKRLPVAYEGLGGPAFVLTPEVALALEKYQDRIAQDVMKKAREICSGSNVKVEEKIVSGDARESLCEAVKNFEADFLVIGSHGYGAIKRAVLGSVSDYCAHHAKCPVLIVRKPHHHH